MEYKNTLNLPKTDFPMKADLPKKEPVCLAKWQEQDIYRLIRVNTKGRPRYILHDGPPYANGDIHIGHALNKTLKDIVVKYKTMRGFDSAYVPGWDCHGLPIEHALFKELKIAKHQIGQVEFRKKAYDYAMRYVSNQREQFKRLGVFGDWENPYLTLSHDYEESIVSSFGKLVKQGYIYRGLKPVNWCFKCETALAEAEVEYENHTSPSVFVKFKLLDEAGFGKDTFLLIWTTTPWTLIANVAVAVHPDFTYLLVKTSRGNMIIAESLLDKVMQASGIEKYEVAKTFKGRDLEGAGYTHPFGLRSGKVVLADYVSAEDGSGLVHTAPGHGAEDYQTGLKYKLDIVMPVTPQGTFDKSAGEFSGLNVYDANKVIIEKLQKIDALLFDTKVQHSYPHCWRCKNPIIFRATNQWFLSIDRDGLRDKLLKIIAEDVRWVPAAGKERISAMVSTRPDWCLSRQRYWGVPVPALVCGNCGYEFFDSQVIEKFAQFTALEGSDCWFERDLKDFLNQDSMCPECQSKQLKRGQDILDVWFDSGVSHQAVLKKRDELGKKIPCQLYLEGSDQHRGWFQSSLISAACIDAMAPFKEVLTHGFVVDGEGRKMSKSLGNVISPQDIIKDYGADILRMWVASSNYNEDIRISKEILSRLSEGYRKIRNTVRFILSNLYDYNPDTDKVDWQDLKKIDKYILIKMKSQVLPLLNESFDNFDFYKAYKIIYDFCNENLSMSYLDMIKGRLYTSAALSKERRAAQTAIYEILNFLVRVTAPILTFTAEEIWQYMPKEKKDSGILSVHLLEWPPVMQSAGVNAEDNVDFGILEKLISGLIPDIAKALEEKRAAGLIGSSFDAKIYLLTKDEIRYKSLECLKADLCEIFKASQVSVDRLSRQDLTFVDSGNYPDISIGITKADGTKCQRCWNYSQEVGKDTAHPDLCDTCLEAIKQN